MSACRTSPPRLLRRQRGVTLIVGMIMMVLITLIVIGAFTLSSTNLKSVLNTQVRAEAISAANEALERVVSSNFYVAPAAQTITLDLNNDGVVDYTVAVAAPVCIKATVASAAAASDVELGSGMSSAGTWFTDWDLDATVTDAATGASVRIKEGTRAMISSAQKSISCP